MINHLRGRRAARNHIVPEAVAALRYIEGMGHTRPALLAYHPVARVNPFLVTLYGGLWNRGIAPQPLFHLQNLDTFLPLLRSGTPVILHLHWTTEILDESLPEDQARARVEEHLALIDEFLAAGGSLLWTVHNLLPHDCRYPQLAAWLQQQLVDRAALVHVLNSRTATAAAEWFRLRPEQTVHIPHPNYVRAYPSIANRCQARFDLGLEPDDIVYAAVGSIRPYKGLDLLLEAFDLLSERSAAPRRLIVAGQPSEHDVVQDTLDRCHRHPHVVLRARLVPDNDLAMYMRAADLAVLPYRRSLNSGLLMLAFSFGLPVVVPALETMTELAGPEVARTFTPGDARSLADALLAADELLTPQTRKAALDVAERFDPDEIAERFADVVAGTIPGDDGAG